MVWKGDRYRHGLSARGIKTKIVSGKNNMKAPIKTITNAIVKELKNHGIASDVTATEDNVTIFFAKPGHRFMEDSIEITNLEDLDDEQMERFGDIPTTIFAKALKGKDGVVTVDLWGKNEITGLESEDYATVREVVDKIAENHNLLKVYSWGADNGGQVIFDDDGDTIVKTYYEFMGDVLVDEYGPDDEFEYWLPFTGE